MEFKISSRFHNEDFILVEENTKITDSSYVLMNNRIYTGISKGILTLVTNVSRKMSHFTNGIFHFHTYDESIIIKRTKIHMR